LVEDGEALLDDLAGSGLRAGAPKTEITIVAILPN